MVPFFKISLGCLFLAYSTVADKDAAAPNRSGVNCILAPPGDSQSDSQTGADSTGSKSALPDVSSSGPASDNQAPASSSVPVKSSSGSTNSNTPTQGSPSDMSGQKSQSSSAKLLSSVGTQKKLDSSVKSSGSSQSIGVNGDSSPSASTGSTATGSSDSSRNSGDNSSGNGDASPVTQGSFKIVATSAKAMDKGKGASGSKLSGKKAEIAGTPAISSNNKKNSKILAAQSGSSKDQKSPDQQAQLLDANTSDATAVKVTSDTSPSSTSRSSSQSFAGTMGNSPVDATRSASTKTTAVKSSHFVPGAVLLTGDDSDSLGTKFDSSKWVDRTAKNQQANVWTELDSLRGRDKMTAGEIQDILAKAVAGKDYPNYATVPKTSFSCEKVNQAGFYADPEARCQVIRRCDINSIQWNYLCPNATMFNQISLTCDWYFNIDCSKAVHFYDFSNSRLYHSDWVLLDTPPENKS